MFFRMELAKKSSWNVCNYVDNDIDAGFQGNKKGLPLQWASGKCSQVDRVRDDYVFIELTTEACTFEFANIIVELLMPSGVVEEGSDQIIYSLMVRVVIHKILTLLSANCDPTTCNNS